jgi:T4 RnlA family RNA ligase
MQYEHIDILNKYVSDGLIHVQKHHTFDYFIYNYSQTVQFKKMWDEVTVACRGLILSSDGNIIARPFRKFFNLQEHDIKDIPFDLPYTVFEKMDGSLGITYRGEDGNVYVATRGSFQSEQAVKATEMLRMNTDLYNMIQSYSDEYTFLFEIIYPENRIVVNYGDDEKLVLLGSYHIKTNNFVYPSFYKKMMPSIITPQEFTVSSIDELMNSHGTNFEGYVVRFQNDFRVKVKLDEYVRLHRIMTNVSNVSVWEALRNDEGLEDILQNVPDEFYNWVGGIISDLQKKYDDILFAVCGVHNHIVYDMQNSTRKEIAMYLLENHKNIASILFAILDGKKHSQMIWDMVRPKYQKPFYQKEKDNV